MSVAMYKRDALQLRLQLQDRAGGQGRVLAPSFPAPPQPVRTDAGARIPAAHTTLA